MFAQPLYHGVPQEFQPVYMGEMYGPGNGPQPETPPRSQPLPQMMYYNYYYNTPSNREPQKWSNPTIAKGAPQFIIPPRKIKSKKFLPEMLQRHKGK